MHLNTPSKASLLQVTVTDGFSPVPSAFAAQYHSLPSRSVFETLKLLSFASFLVQTYLESLNPVVGGWVRPGIFPSVFSMASTRLDSLKSEVISLLVNVTGFPLVT